MAGGTVKVYRLSRRHGDPAPTFDWKGKRNRSSDAGCPGRTCGKPDPRHPLSEAVGSAAGRTFMDDIRSSNEPIDRQAPECTFACTRPPRLTAEAHVQLRNARQ